MSIITKVVLLILVVFCFDGCKNYTDYTQLLPHEYHVKKVLSTKVSVSELILYHTDDSISINKLKGYPINNISKRWEIRYWEVIQSESERLDIINFLKGEIKKYSSQENSKAFRLLKQLISELSENKGGYLISYIYNKGDKPGSENFHYYSWLYLYILNLKVGQLISITNAFR